MAIEILSDWNERLEQCCGCGMPECPTPSVLSRKKVGEADAVNGDYRTAVNTWEDDRAAWVAEDPENREPGDYPVDPPEVPEGSSDGHGSFFSMTSSGTYAPLSDPALDPDDDVPAIYREFYLSAFDTYIYGAASSFDAEGPGYGGSEDVSAEFYVIHTIPENNLGLSQYTVETNLFWNDFGMGEGYEEVNESTTVFGSGPSTGTQATVYRYRAEDYTSEDTLCTGALIKRNWLTLDNTDTIHTVGPNTGPHETVDPTEYRSALQQEKYDELRLEDSITRSGLITEATTALAAADWEDAEVCESSLATTWPKIQEVLDRWSGMWPACSTAYAPTGGSSFPVILGATATAESCEGRFKVPYSHPGTYFKFTYDVLTEPDGWDDTIDDPEYVPPEPLPDPVPPVPQIPDPEAPHRSVVRDTTVTWAGPGTPVPDPIIVDEVVTNQEAIDTAEETWLTEPFVLDPPTEPGMKRLVNIRFECYHGALYGVKPQLMGEGWEPEEWETWLIEEG